MMECGKCYHIYNRGINKAPIFFEDANYGFFLQRFSKYLLKHVDVFSYCLMPNHFHFLIRVKENGSTQSVEGEYLTVLQKAFRDFFISYSKSINKRYNRTGALFQYKFKRKEIQNDAYFTRLIYYIHHNPIKAGLCQKLGQWKYSSYQSILNPRSTEINRMEVLDWFGGEGEFVKFHRTYQQEDKITHYLFKE